MKKLILTVAMIVMATAMCQAKSPIKGNGAEKKDARTIESYTAISVTDGIAVNFSREQLSGVVVSADENVCEYVVTEVIGGELVIRFRTGENIKPKKDVVVTVPNNRMVTALTIGDNCKFNIKEEIVAESMKLTLLGGAQVEMKLDVRQNVQIEMIGNGKCELAGKADELKLIMEGSSKFNGYNFKTKKVACELAGGSDAKIQCNDRIDVADLSGNSTLYFKGDCEIGFVSLKGGSTLGNR
ncbi:MAG: DUF2807 domain-containing protein [Rikenellaceae bacterium]|nr:DUF2807 domain-containing protein [Rikenellaceae bacterium]